MSNSSNWSTCEIVSCAIAAAIGLIVFLATREAITFVGALLVGVALGAILYVALTRLICTEGAAERRDTPAARASAAPAQPAEPDATAPEAPAPEAAEAPAAEASERPAAKAAAAEDASAVKSGTQLPGEEELAARKGEWKYQGGEAPAPAGGATKPEGLAEARGGQPDDLKQIKGVGPKLEQLLHSMGYFHFDQIAGWGPDEVAWVDENLKGFKGRVSRDNWVEQARVLAAGGETEFSKRARSGDVY